MKKSWNSCCTAATGKPPDTLEIPEPVRKELEEMGGFEVLAAGIPPAAELVEKGRVYHALSDPIRLTILYLVRDQPLCVCVINQYMKLAGSKLSYHLNILKETGLISGEYHGNWIIYSITGTGKRYLQ
jgi:ArsR family transcriptional regulator